MLICDEDEVRKVNVWGSEGGLGGSSKARNHGK